MAAKRNPTRPGTPPHLRDRVRALQRRLRSADAQIDALLVTNPRDIRYLTGFVGDDSWALIPVSGTNVAILSDFRFQEQIQREAPHARAVMRKKTLGEELKKLIEQRSIERIGVQAEHMTLAQRKTLAKRIGARRIAELDDGLLKQRAVKDQSEIKAIQKALRIQEQTFRDVVDMIALDAHGERTEQEVAAHLEFHMRLLGAEGRSFPTIVAADANASLPHAIPGKKKIKKGSTLLIDWGARVDGYCADLTRVVALGRMKPRIREIYQIVLDAQLAAIDAIAPGVSMKAVDQVARDYIAEHGYGERFGHSLGHGLGMDVHELPTLSPRSEGALEPGQVVTVEPGIYLPGVGGVRIEDDVLVTARGARVLSRLPKSLKEAII